METREQQLLWAAQGALPHIDPTGSGRVWIDNLRKAIRDYDPRKIAVIAGNHRQASDFLNTIGDKTRFVVAGSPEHLRGYRIEGIVTTGTWWERTDLNETLQAARVAML